MQRAMKKEKVISAIRPTKGDRVLDVFIILTLVIIGIVVTYPIWLVMIASISDPSYISLGKVWLLPKGLNLDAYRKLYATREIWIGYRNSLFYTIVGTTLQMIVTTSAAYALSRPRLPFKRVLSLYFLFIMYFSGGMIPTYFVVKDLGMVNTVWALLLPGIFGPYNLVICRSYFENAIPEEIFESAQMDGASQFRCFVQLAVPLAKPTLAVMVLNFALGHWNSYFNALLYISNDNIQSLQVFIKRITQQAAAQVDLSSANMNAVIEQIRETQLLKYAIVVVSTLPMIMLYPLIRRYFISGMMIGAIKG